MVELFQSTLPARGATDLSALRGERNYHISIHAPRTGSDNLRRCLHQPEAHFNPRSPHGERPPVISPAKVFDCNFNPRSPHGERRFRDGSHLSAWGISIHAPRTGSDNTAFYSKWSCDKFQSTLPARGATRNNFAAPSLGIFQSTLPARGATAPLEIPYNCIIISIHAPRTGSDELIFD